MNKEIDLQRETVSLVHSTALRHCVDGFVGDDERRWEFLSETRMNLKLFARLSHWNRFYVNRDYLYSVKRLSGNPNQLNGSASGVHISSELRWASENHGRGRAFIGVRENVACFHMGDSALATSQLSCRPCSQRAWLGMTGGEEVSKIYPADQILLLCAVIFVFVLSSIVEDQREAARYLLMSKCCIGPSKSQVVYRKGVV